MRIGKKLATLLLAAGLALFQADGWAKTGNAVLDDVMDMDITCQSQAGAEMRDCAISMNGKESAKAREIRIDGLEEGRAGFIGLYGFETPHVSIDSIEYEGIEGSPHVVIAMLSSDPDSVTEEVMAAWDILKIGKVSFSGMAIRDGQDRVEIRKGDVHDARISGNGKAGFRDIVLFTKDGPVARIGSLSCDALSFPDAAGIFAVAEMDPEKISDREAGALLNLSIRNLKATGIAFAELESTIGEFFLDYAGNGKGADGRIKVAEAVFPGEFLAPAGIMGAVSGKIAADLDNIFAIVREEGKFRLSQDASLSLSNLLDMKIRLSMASKDGGKVNIPDLKLLVIDKGVVSAIPAPMKKVIEGLVEAALPGIQDTAARFLSAPGQEFAVSRVEGPDGVKVEVSETGSPEWFDGIQEKGEKR